MATGIRYTQDRHSALAAAAQGRLAYRTATTYAYWTQLPGMDSDEKTTSRRLCVAAESLYAYGLIRHNHPGVIQFTDAGRALLNTWNAKANTP